MGDAVLNFVTADLVYKHRPELSEGNLTKLRSVLVSTKPLAAYARKINLHEYIRIGHSITLEQVKKSDKILENVFEALVGAIYLDAGMKPAYRLISSLLLEDIKAYDIDDLTDYKSKLQEEIQAEHRDAVQYVTVETKGPAHDRTFKVQVLFNGIVLGVGVPSPAWKSLSGCTVAGVRIPCFQTQFPESVRNFEDWELYKPIRNFYFFLEGIYLPIS